MHGLTHESCKNYIIYLYRKKYLFTSKTLVRSEEFNSICPMNINSNKKKLRRNSFFPLLFYVLLSLIKDKYLQYSYFKIGKL